MYIHWFGCQGMCFMSLSAGLFTTSNFDAKINLIEPETADFKYKYLKWQAPGCCMSQRFTFIALLKIK